MSGRVFLNCICLALHNTRFILILIQEEIVVDRVREYFQRDELAKTLGIELLEVAPGRAVARMRLEKRHTNSLGIAHGGALFSLADFAFAVACNSHGRLSVAVNCSISFISAAHEGIVTAEAEEIAPHAKMAPYLVRIRNEAGEVVAVMQGLAYRKRETIEDALSSAH